MTPSFSDIILNYNYDYSKLQRTLGLSAWGLCIQLRGDTIVQQILRSDLKREKPPPREASESQLRVSHVPQKNVRAVRA